ncbi:DeoR/GlpR transcriptional regulator [Tessaracoccus sp. MC1865]|uniref:DeoR/GlpR family DNA-binding transcription regulator n=1 Tax=Tessaracoccus sp. MC1865 TaxID=2760310 RepID=UPI001603ECFF|nr:DeoR/GlpR family DNA-binding transcription regulator [Tessaracoccus sp. MC1865]MBB1483142.1 DeoR/GlpR transcriptional regulator [Tessaracoccus sp. MC1865]QTO37430.1 DeoR/GlpR transcriptional regulator [Tessaracoccus sp. MC1865]
MLTDVRLRRVAEFVHAKGSASVPELASTLGVSEATVRRDLQQLSDAGLVERVRGGACRPHSIRPEADHAAFDVVAGQETHEKRRIAKAAAELINDGDVVALDIGTTVFAMCPYLRSRSITVVTASLAVVAKLSDAPHVDLVVMGGVLRPNYQSLVGVLTESCLRQVRVDVAFLGAAGIRPDGAVLDSTPSEVPVKRAMIEVSTRSWLLADHAKFPGAGFLEIAPVTAFTGLITDSPAGPESLHLPPETNLEVRYP